MTVGDRGSVANLAAEKRSIRSSSAAGITLAQRSAAIQVPG